MTLLPIFAWIMYMPLGNAEASHETPEARSSPRFAGEAGQNIEIQIFDIHGKLVQKLATCSLILASGITWYASGQPSGVYILRVNDGVRALSKRIVLQK
jgi:hypothetical protein